MALHKSKIEKRRILMSMQKLLETDRSVTIHIRNLQILATDIFNVSKDLSLTIFSKFF